MFMKVASILRAMSASFIDGKSVNFCVSKTEPLSLCCVIQLVTGQVSRRHHIQVIGPASNAQGHQDRREKRQRVHARFQRVLTAANILAAMTAPLQRGSSGAWTPEQHMTEEDRSRFYQTLETLMEGLRQATVDLRLEGLSEPIAAGK